MLSLTAEMVFILGASVVTSAGRSKWLSKIHQRRDEAMWLGRRWAEIFVFRVGVIVVVAAASAVGVLSIGASPVIHRVTGTIKQMMSANPEADFTGGRKSIWKDTMTMIHANPWFGIGLGAYETAYPNYRAHPVYINDNLFMAGQAHNDYLQALADCGVVGGAIAVWFLVSVFRAIGRSIRSPDPRLAGLALGGGAGVCGILVHSLVDFNLQLLSTALLFLLLLAVIWRIAFISQVAVTQSAVGQGAASQDLGRFQ
jgi:O-antigen ligase